MRSSLAPALSLVRSTAMAMLVLLCAVGGATGAAAEDAVWRYTVRPGDNIWDLSRRYLADWRNWPEIQALNGIDQPRRIPPGSRLDIPLRLLRLEPAAATLSATHGEVTLLRGGAASTPIAGQELRIDDRLVTGDEATAVVRFADGSQLALAGGGELVLDRLSRYRGTDMVDTRLRLERGRIETLVQPAAGSGSLFEVWTPPAVSSVRGTDLRIGLDETATRGTTEVLTGVVQVSALATARRVPAGFGIVTRQGQPPEPPRPLLEPPAATDLPLRLERLPLRLPMPPLAGAARFRLGLATDESFRELLFDQVVEAGSAARLELPDGSYLARLRGIEADGLEGQDRVWRIEVHARPEPPVPLAPEREGRLRDPRPEFRWAAPLGAQGYRFALATEPAFTAPLIETETLAGTSFSPAAPLPLGAYYWRLSTIDGAGRQGPWSDVQPLEIVAPPADPTIDAVESERGRLTIRLAALEPGQQVRYQIATDPAFTDLLADRTVVEPELVVPGVLPGDYWFRAQIIEADGYIAEFGTPQSINVPPARWWPVLLVPFALMLLLL